MEIIIEQSSMGKLAAQGVIRQDDSVGGSEYTTTPIGIDTSDVASELTAGAPRRRQLALPAPVNCVFPPVCHPMYDSVKEESDRWALSLFHPAAHDLRLTRGAYLHGLLPLWTACNFPFTVSSQRLLLLTEFCTWLFILDDTIDEADAHTASNLVKHFAELLTSPSTPLCASSPTCDSQMLKFMERLRTEVWEKMCRGMSSDLYHRLVSEMLRSIEAQKDTAHLRRPPAFNDDSRPPAHVRLSVEEMVELRVIDGYSWTAMCLVEYALGFDRPDISCETQMGRLLQQMLEAAAKHFVMANDFFSFGKEMATSDAMSFIGCLVTQQLVNGVSIHPGCVSDTDMEEILGKAWEMIKQQECICADLLHQIRTEARNTNVLQEDDITSNKTKDCILTYAVAVCSLISGNLYFSTCSGRYVGAHPIPWNTYPAYLVLPNAPYRPLNALA